MRDTEPAPEDHDELEDSSWYEHPLTRQCLKLHAENLERARAELMNTAAISSDPAVREARAKFEYCLGALAAVSKTKPIYGLNFERSRR